MNFRLLTFIAVALLSNVLLLNASSLVLVKNREAKFQIVISPQATVVEKYAAAELQQAVKRASGAEPRIVEGAAEAGFVPVILGTPETTPAIAALDTKLSPGGKLALDEILIHTGDQSLLIGGNNPRSVLYSAYRFLEEAFSYRWFWPGVDGEFFKPSNDCVIDDLNIHENAALKYRSLGINAPHYDEETLIWMARNRLNVHNTHERTTQDKSDNLHEKGFLNRFAGHNLVLPRKLLEEHPEYVAEFGGKRTLHPAHSPHLCWSNPGVQQALIETVRQWQIKSPMVDIWSFYPADQTQFCECSKCIEMAKDVSTRFQKLSGIIIKEIRKSKPDACFMTLAYQAYRDVPTEMAPFEAIQYTTYNVSYRHPFSSNHPANAVAIKEIHEWKKLGANIGLRAYDMIPFVERMFTPLVYYVVDEVAFAKSNGLSAFSTEVTPFNHPKTLPPEQRNWDTNRMNLYAIAQAMWHKEVNAKEIVRDWTQMIYGAAAPAMEQYYFAMEEAWRKAPGDISYFLHPAAPHTRGFITKELVNKAQELFTQGRRELENATSDSQKKRALEQIAFEEKMFNEWKGLYEKLSENADRYTAYAGYTEAPVSALMDVNFKGWQKAPKLPAFEARKGTLRDQTEVSALWSEGTLFLRFICHDSKPGVREVRFANHDEKIYSDDSIELFLNTGNQGEYYHLAFNSLGARYDSKSQGGMNLDVDANPQWETKAVAEKDRWSAVIALPLAEFGLKSGDGSEVALSLKRTRPGSNLDYPHSGWPDASYHSPASYGIIKQVKELPKQVLILGGSNSARRDALEVAYRKHGWKVDNLEKEEGLEMGSFDAAVLWYGFGKDFPLSTDFIQHVLQPWLEGGGLLVISAQGKLPFSEWFGRGDLDLKWSGWGIDPVRRSSSIADGDWVRLPNDLTRAFQTNTTPASGFYRDSEVWESLASQKMKDGDAAHYLLRTKVGQGTLVLTTSSLGQNGGFEIFGSMRPDNVVKLIENLLHSKSIPQI